MVNLLRGRALRLRSAACWSILQRWGVLGATLRGRSLGVKCWNSGLRVGRAVA